LANDPITFNVNPNKIAFCGELNLKIKTLFQKRVEEV
jgi:hypothetical protein